MLTNSVSQPPALNLPPVSVAASGSNGQGSCLAPLPLVDEMVWVRSYVSEVQAAEELYRLFIRFNQDLALRATESEQAIDALWAGHCCVKREAEESCRQATKRGLLLMLVVA